MVLLNTTRELAPLEIRLFGSFEVRVLGEALPPLRSRKGQWLLALLTLKNGQSVDRDWLASVLWPETLENQSLYSLRRSLADLRHALGSQEGRISSPTPRTLSLDLSGAWVDVILFDKAIKQGERETAVGVYQGPLLPGCLEEWVLPERQARQELYLEALEKLAQDAINHGNLPTAIHQLRQALACDPLREPVYRALMRSLAAGGDYAAAVQLYHDLQNRFSREFRLDPSSETRELFQQIRTRARQEASHQSSVISHQSSVISPPSPVISDQLPVTGHQTQPSTPNNLHSATLHPHPHTPLLEPPGGAVPLHSPFYVVRPTDRALAEAIERQDSIVLIKGVKGTGKTSLLARGLQGARQAGVQVIRTDFQKLAAADLESAETLYYKLASSIIEQLQVEASPDRCWRSWRGPGVNFERFWQKEILEQTPGPVVWGLDEVDRLFSHPFASEIFGLFRSWHNDRAMDPEGPWHRFTMVIAYATEASLFITDVNQSPFTVGTRLQVADFTLDQVKDLNQRYGSPLKEEAEVERFFQLVGGHPSLVRRGLHEMVCQGLTIADLEFQEHRDEGVFDPHLRGLLDLLARHAELGEVVRRVLQGQPARGVESFYRLRSAGIISGETTQEMRPRCRLYASYLGRHLV